MGITCGWVSARTSKSGLVEAMLKAWDDCEVVRTEEASGLDALHAEQERVRREEKERGQALSALGLYEVGERAVCVDPQAVLQTAGKEMGKLSELVGPTLGLTLGTHGGVAGFEYFVDGRCARRVWNDNGEVQLDGDPIAEESGIAVDEFYWEQSEQLWKAFGLGELGEWDGPLDIVVLRNHGTERFLAELAEKRRAGAPPGKRPWWRFW